MSTARSAFSFSQVAVIEALWPDEYKSGTLLSKLINRLRRTHPHVPKARLFEVGARDQLLAVLKQLTDAAADGSWPIVHIEMHGWDDRSGLAFPDGGSLSWDELAEALVPLNEATHFNLIVCIAACFGAHSVGSVKPSRSSPCFALIGPTASTDGPELLRSFCGLYRKLLLDLEMGVALQALHARQLNEGGFISVTAEDWFFKLSEGYLREHCNPVRLKEREEAVIYELTRAGKALNSAQRAEIAKIGERLAMSFLDRQFPIFFMIDRIPDNELRFGASLAAAKRRALAVIAG